MTDPPSRPVVPAEKDEAAKVCGCGLEPPSTFPREPARGDWCPVGPMNLHHWHGDQCAFCSRTSAARNGAST